MSEQRRLDSITLDELDALNGILEGEYFGPAGFKSADAVMYLCFTDRPAIFSGRGVVRVCRYLESVGIDVIAELERTDRDE